MFKKISKIILTRLLFLAAVFVPISSALALNPQDAQITQETQIAQSSQNIQESQANFLKAEIVRISNGQEVIADDGTKTYEQTIELKGLEGEWKDKLISIEKSQFNTLGPKSYKVGDVMLLTNNKDNQGQDHFAIIDYVRENSIYFLIFLFVGLVFLIGRKKGIKAIISLVLSFLVIIYFIIPQIAGGADPVFISAIGAMIIMLLAIYLTYGFDYFSHLGAASMIFSLIITVLLSQIFTEVTRLTGQVDESATILAQLLGPSFNAKGLLLAGFIIGALGILDDVIINQLSIIEELHKTDKNLSSFELFKKGLKVGVDHISAIVNTLFLAYTGTSMPLILLFAADKTMQYNLSTVVNMETIATEIVRTLTGSIGIILSVPISTLIAAIFIPKFFSKRALKKLSEQKHTHHVHA